MKSDVFKVKDNATCQTLLAEVDRFGRFCRLDDADVGKLQLLAEEMVAIISKDLHRMDCDFWLENTDNCFELHLQAKARISFTEKDELTALSSDGKNAATKGVLGKIGGMFQSLLISEGELGEYGYMPEAGAIAPTEGLSQLWSMADYQNGIPENERKADWDGLERSILANMADDVRVGVTSNTVEMTVTIQF
ncbi:MAG: hypothetical protein GXY32_06345 [Ruminococcaceae bacterium]|nr:hypothetical protein [Oscillospiraceae bacterium]